MTWVLFTLLAVVMQTWRNALQSKLSAHVHTSGVTLSRFLFAPPIVAIYLYGLYLYQPMAIPEFNTRFIIYACIAAATQIAATAFMVILFKQKNFAVGAGLAKSEALVAGVLGVLFFGSNLSLLGWLGIFIGSIAIFVLSSAGKKGSLSPKTLMIGLACGTCFALTSLLAREASHLLDVPFHVGAAWSLLWVLCIQTLALTLYIFKQQPQVLAELSQHKIMTIATSITSCIGSIGWFTAMALQHVALVKTLGQTEVLFTIMISVWWLKKPVQRYEIIGLLLIAVAAILVMWS
ncbi:DMT family transporter [Psychrosphaera sp. B3R10]|uniref:DMT family transporter n=1 Tax=unclassified Psychrosphaera TaxID=2641570 RepID=UPI001C0A0CA3|nr:MULTISPECIES: DMT family transporter [unclassified Psychrosphaera]MBU2883149.1 DMT family transporter [Psychrosphaera sp. I2R16]MBU2988605.1 DMT family transporter [Psychrosphaera sp. B3R10]